jgi:hypothetical protein
VIRRLDTRAITLSERNSIVSIPFDQLRRQVTHILAPNYRTTVCGIELKRNSLSQTVYGDYVFDSVETVLSKDGSGLYDSDHIVLTDDDSNKSILCEACLDNNLPSVDRSKPKHWFGKGMRWTPMPI